jgi:hypothetical protein
MGVPTIIRPPSNPDPRTNLLEIGFSHDCFMCAGSFVPGLPAVAASKAAVGNWDVVETLTVAGATAGVTFALTAGGGPACSYTFSLTHYDSTLQTKTGATGWTVYILPNSPTGAGVTITENATLKEVVIFYEPTVSTRPLIDAKILATCSYIFVKTAGVATAALAASEGTSHALNTAPTSCACLTSATTVVEYFTNAVTTITVAKASMAGNPFVVALMTCSGGTGATVLATGDAIAADALVGGVDAVAVSTIRGQGFTVAVTGNGEHTITIGTDFYALIAHKVTLQLATADDKHAQVGTIIPASRTIVVRTWDISGAAVANVAANANNRINFFFILTDSANYKS